MNNSEPLTFVGGFHWHILLQYLRQNMDTAKANVLRSAVIPTPAGIKTIDFVTNELFMIKLITKYLYGGQMFAHLE